MVQPRTGTKRMVERQGPMEWKDMEEADQVLSEEAKVKCWQTVIAFCGRLAWQANLKDVGN